MVSPSIAVAGIAALWLAACDTGVLAHNGGTNGDGGESGLLDGRGDTLGDSAMDHTDVSIDSSRPCSSDTDCMGNPAGGHCDLATQTCQACGQNPNTCPTGQYCDATFHCVGGCGSDMDCVGISVDAGSADATGGAGARCDVPHHTCVQCLADPDCPSDLVCHHNQCVMGCSATRPCPTGSDCCNGVCVDLLTDTDHCGSCLHNCDTGSSCCHGICYDLTSDARHCGGCGTMCSLPNATASCTTGMCTVATCTPGFGDCDGDPSNGCEAPLGSDPNHCGTCTTVCTSGPHVVSTCDSAVCHSTCAPGFLHCSSDPTVGCEVNPSSDPNNCGVCGNVCTGAHVATGGCAMGACTVVSCNPGFTDCDAIASNGCEANTLNDPLDCGACFHVCPSGPFSTPVCTSGACSVTCIAGHGDCNAMPADGCEADFSSDVNHCGGCATTCPARPNSTPICSMGSCANLCSGSFQDCNHVVTDGCEANLLTDTSNCGACGNTCTAPHGTAACSSGACTIMACAAGFANCNGVVADGCETPTTADPLNCGACNSVCAAPAFASATCSASTCGFTCLAGHANCDGLASNGCETDLSSTVTHCGACGTSCPTPPHSAPTCSSSTCGYTCLPGFADCNGSAADGCEVNLATDVNNCGTCRTMCAIAHATPTCSAGSCQIGSCNAGFADCNGMVTDGCETNTTGDVSNCGACLNACPMGMFATASCSGSMCSASCSAGHGDCNMNPADGCEVTFASDPSHCGSCGTACPTHPNTTPTCTASACGFICQSGFRDCNGLATDGCERNIRTDVNNCGTCGMVCTAPNGVPACNSGSCGIGSCNAGFADCNGMLSDGCETHTAVDSNNCGACGNVCTGGRVCVAGACTLVNPFPSTGADGAFSPVGNTVLAPRVYNYTTINIPAGVTVSTNGTGVLELRAQGNVTIAGTVDVSGGNGGAGVRPTGGGGGGATAQRVTAATGIPGGTGTGGQPPAGANSSGCVTNGLGGTNGGGSGSLGTLTVGGGGGGGPAGGGGGLIGGGCNGGAGGGGAPPGAGGQAGGPPYDGTPGQSGYDPCNGLGAGGGGGSIGMAAASDLSMSTTLQSGSGGGGGSASYGTGLSGAEGGGGGGAGAVRIASGTSITITGSVLANGGAGGAGGNANATCSLAEGGAGGGGGSGGAIYLAAPTLNVSGSVSAAGGAGGPRGANMNGGDGGAGGLGRLRITTVSTMCSLTGTFTPALHSGCGASSTSGFAYVASYPF